MMTPEKIAWVTGATSGVGRHLTGCLLQRGWQVLATGRDESLLHQVAEQDRWPKDKIFLLRQDVRSSDDWETVCNHLLKRWGQFDLLLNIAAYLNPGYPSAVSDGDIDTHFDTNVKGLIKGCRTAVALW
jgi:NADP-dependent 3-hydroxy acid dehydrogenase YdfG